MKNVEEWDAWDEVQKFFLLIKRATDGATMNVIFSPLLLDEIHMLLHN